MNGNESGTRMKYLIGCGVLVVAAVALAVFVTPFALFALVCVAMLAAMVWMMAQPGHRH